MYLCNWEQGQQDAACQIKFIVVKNNLLLFVKISRTPVWQCLDEGYHTQAVCVMTYSCVNWTSVKYLNRSTNLNKVASGIFLLDSRIFHLFCVYMWILAPHLSRVTLVVWCRVELASDADLHHNEERAVRRLNCPFPRPAGADRWLCHIQPSVWKPIHDKQ